MIFYEFNSNSSLFSQGSKRVITKWKKYKIANIDQLFLQSIFSNFGTCIRLLYRINIKPQEVELLTQNKQNN